MEYNWIPNSTNIEHKLDIWEAKSILKWDLEKVEAAFLKETEWASDVGKISYEKLYLFFYS